MAGTLLLADDSITIQKVVELTFAGSELSVIAVSSGRELLERLGQVNPDIVLCDVVMPELDGYEVCQRLKSDPSTLHIPVVLLTGTFEPFDRDRALAAGCDAIVTKPFEAKELVRIVEELLETGRTDLTGVMPGEEGSGIPEGVPSLDFTTTGFDRMVPPDADEPALPEEGLELTSTGMPAAAGSDPGAVPEAQEVEGEEPWVAGAPEGKADGPPEDETFPSPSRPTEAAPGWTELDGGAAEGDAAPSPWDTSPPPGDGSPWDTAPKTVEAEEPAPPPGWAGRPAGAPPPFEPVPFQEVEVSPEEGEWEEPAASGIGEVGEPIGSVPDSAPRGLQPLSDAPDLFPGVDHERLSPAEGVDEGGVELAEPSEVKGAELPPLEAAGVAEAGEVSEDTPEPVVAAPALPVEAPAAPVQIRDFTDEEVDRIARRVVELAQPMFERIAWEVIPDMAEMLVHRRIRELEASVDEEN